MYVYEHRITVLIHLYLPTTGTISRTGNGVGSSPTGRFSYAYTLKNIQFLLKATYEVCF